MATAGARSYRSIALFVAVNLISIICLIWALHGINLRRLGYDIAHLDWGWVAVSVASSVLLYVLQGWRWSLVLAPVAHVPVWRSTRAIFVGLYANEVLPLRSGEIIRCYLQARWSELPVSVTLASALIERIFDGLWLMACLFTAFRLAPVPYWMREAAFYLGLLIAVCAILIGLAMYWREQTLDKLVNVSWLSWAHVLIKDLHLIGHSRYLYFAFFVSAPFMILQVLPIYAVLRGFHETAYLALSRSFVLMVILRLNAVVPQAPGNVGTFQWATVQSLELFGVARGIAKRFSFILWALITLPLLVAGFVAVALTGTSLGHIHHQARTSVGKRDEVPRQQMPVDDTALKR